MRRRNRAVVTAENGNIIGGLGSAVMMLSEHPVPLERVTLKAVLAGLDQPRI